MPPREPIDQAFLEYGQRRSRSRPAASTVLCGILVVVLSLGLVLQLACDKPLHMQRLSDVISSMRGSVSSGSAQSDAYTKIEAAIAKGSSVVNLTRCDPADGSCNTLESVQNATKANFGAAVRSFAQANERALYMVFAPWCGHCHKAMPAFMEASKSIALPCALVNAELVSADIVEGASSLLDVKHFPFFVRCAPGTPNVVLEVEPSVENLLKFAA